LLKYSDITRTFSIRTPLLWGFALPISTRISGYGGLRTFVESDRLSTLCLSAIPHHKLPLQHRIREHLALVKAAQQEIECSLHFA
jgi:hypothetical protein